MDRCRNAFFFVSLVFLATSTLNIAKAENIESRVANQQGKIGNKRASKKLTAAQASRADDMTYKITNEEQEMKTKHRGKLTRRDKAKLERQLNRNDRIINGETSTKRKKN